MYEKILNWPGHWSDCVATLQRQASDVKVWLSAQHSELLLQAGECWWRLSMRQPGRLKLQVLQGDFNALSTLTAWLREAESPASSLASEPLKTLPPWPEALSFEDLLRYPAFLQTGWQAFFPEAKALNLEIGCGYAHFLSWLAPRHPEQGFVGLDIVSKVLRRAGKRLRNSLNAAEPPNVLLGKLDALLTLRELVAPASLAHLYILFPDPWPKERHQRRRTLRPDTLLLFASRLQRGGRLIFVSDDPDYAREAEALLEASPYFEATDFPEIEVRTKYERKWLEQNKPIRRLAYARRPQPDWPDQGSWPGYVLQRRWTLPAPGQAGLKRLTQETWPRAFSVGTKRFKVQSCLYRAAQTEETPTEAAVLLRLVLSEPGSLAQHGWLLWQADGTLEVPDFAILPALQGRESLIQAFGNQLQSWLELS